MTASKSFPTSSVAVDETTGQTYTSYYDIFTVGAGYLNVAAAVTVQKVPVGTTPSPVGCSTPPPARSRS